MSSRISLSSKWSRGKVKDLGDAKAEFPLHISLPRSGARLIDAGTLSPGRLIYQAVRHTLEALVSPFLAQAVL
jgi:hypothetical protein